MEGAAAVELNDRTVDSVDSDDHPPQVADPNHIANADAEAEQPVTHAGELFPDEDRG